MMQLYRAYSLTYMEKSYHLDNCGAVLRHATMECLRADKTLSAPGPISVRVTLIDAYDHYLNLQIRSRGLYVPQKAC